jgi:hypothetical protein
MKPEKQAMLAMLQRCADVIDGEAGLLDQWRKSPDITAARKADCRRSIEQLSIGETSSKVIVANILEKASGLADDDVKNQPSDSADLFVSHLEDSLKTRSGWDGPNLEQPWFESALAQAEDNAAHAADSASGILSDCAG